MELYKTLSCLEDVKIKEEKDLDDKSLVSKDKSTNRTESPDIIIDVETITLSPPKKKIKTPKKEQGKGIS